MDVEMVNKIATSSGFDLYALTVTIHSEKYVDGRVYKKLLKDRYKELIPPVGDWNEAKQIVANMTRPENYDSNKGLPKVLGYLCDFVDGLNPYFLLTNHRFNFVHQRYLGSISFKKSAAVKKKKEPVDKEFEQIKAIFK